MRRGATSALLVGFGSCAAVGGAPVVDAPSAPQARRSLCVGLDAGCRCRRSGTRNAGRLVEAPLQPVAHDSRVQAPPGREPSSGRPRRGCSTAVDARRRCRDDASGPGSPRLLTALAAFFRPRPARMREKTLQSPRGAWPGSTRSRSDVRRQAPPPPRCCLLHDLPPPPSEIPSFYHVNQ